MLTLSVNHCKVRYLRKSSVSVASFWRLPYYGNIKGRPGSKSTEGVVSIFSVPQKRYLRKFSFSGSSFWRSSVWRFPSLKSSFFGLRFGGLPFGPTDKTCTCTKNTWKESMTQRRSNTKIASNIVQLNFNQSSIYISRLMYQAHPFFSFWR